MQISEEDLGKNAYKLCSDETCTVYKLQDETGDGMMTVYPVFSGCSLIYNDFHMQNCYSRFTPQVEVFCIDHCREGCIEWAIDNTRCLYVGAGDIQVNDRTKHCTNFSFPLQHYHGLTIGFDLEKASPALTHVLEGFSVDLRRLRDKFCLEDRSFVMRAGKQIEHIFSELYDLPEQIRQPYFKIKVLELLLFLDAMERPADVEERPYFYKTQVQKVHRIVALLTEDLTRWYTLEELSERFSFPLTSLKRCFKSMYGCTIATYMKDHRMNAAAMMLQNSEETVISVATKVGYDNPGKFAAAFRSVKGATPTEYRKYFV